MKFRSLFVALVAAVGLSGQASAAFIDGNDANGSSLILDVYDVVTKASFTELLSPQFSTFAPGTSPQVFTGGSSTFASLFGSSSASNIRWEVNAMSTVDANIGNGPGDSGPWSLMFTALSQPASMNGSAMNSAGLNFNKWISLLNSNNTGGIASSTSASQQWNMNGGNPNAWWAGASGGGTVPFSMIGTGFGALNFFTATANGGTSSDASTFAQLAGTWSLASNGALTWNATPVGAVPVPAAAWLLGSGLMGLIGIGRRRESKASA